MTCSIDDPHVRLFYTLLRAPCALRAARQAIVRTENRSIDGRMAFGNRSINPSSSLRLTRQIPLGPEADLPFVSFVRAQVRR